jgi:hypothetical protein
MYEGFYENCENILLSFQIPRKEKDEIKELIDKIRYHEDKNEISGHMKGKLFEDLIYLIFNNRELTKVTQNIRTPDFEIDFVVKLTTAAKIHRNNELIPKWIPDYFVIECKNYKDPVELTYVSKFYGLVDSKDIGLGLFISNKGISGRGKPKWEDAAAFVNKVNLSYMKVEDKDKKRVILDFSLDRIEEMINEGGNCFELINDVKMSLFSDLSYEVSHERHYSLDKIKI